MDTAHCNTLGDAKQLLIEEARGLAEFLEKKLGGQPDAKKEAAARLWDGSEPEFEERLDKVREIHRIIWSMAGDDSGALQIALLMPILPVVPPLDAIGLLACMKRIQDLK